MSEAAEWPPEGRETYIGSVEKSDLGVATLTASRGRAASRDELRERLPSAPLAYLEGATRNPGLTKEEMARLLRNRSASPSLLAQVGRDKRWTHHYDVKRALVRHPKTPYPVSRGLVGQLYWRDVAETMEDSKLHPALRRQAEGLMKERLTEMGPGEMTALARRASGGLITALRSSGNARVLLALLEGARLKEMDAVMIASGESTPGEVLTRLAQHPKWGIQRTVRAALVANARTPVAVALRLVARLPNEELERLAMDDRVPRIVRVGATRQLESEQS